MAYQHGCALAADRAGPSSTFDTDLDSADPAGSTGMRSLSPTLESPQTSTSASGWTVEVRPAASDYDVDEHGPWCVDDGVSIVCLSTLQVWMALAAGRLDPKTKVWRDGRGYWQPIEQIAELTYAPDAQLAEELIDEVPEISEVVIRRQQSALVQDEEDEPPTLPRPPRPRPRPWWLSRAWPVVAGLLLGAILALAAMHLPAAAAEPAAPAGPRLSAG